MIEYSLRTYKAKDNQRTYVYKPVYSLSSFSSIQVQVKLIGWNSISFSELLGKERYLIQMLFSSSQNTMMDNSLGKWIAQVANSGRELSILTIFCTKVRRLTVLMLICGSESWLLKSEKHAEGWERWENFLHEAGMPKNISKSGLRPRKRNCPLKDAVARKFKPWNMPPIWFLHQAMLHWQIIIWHYVLPINRVCMWQNM